MTLLRLKHLFLLLPLLFLASVTFAQGFAFDKQAPIEKIQELLGKTRAEKIALIEKSGIVVREVQFDEPRMLGQYLDLDHYPELKAPEIHLAASADDWTLVHEYIHGLFAANSEPHQLSLFSDYEQANADLLESWTAYRVKWHYTSPEQREKVLRSFTTVARYKLEQLQQFELEEMVIESYLREVYLKQKPAEFSSAAFEISESYLKKSGTAALFSLKALSVACTDMIASYDREHLTTPRDLAGLCASINLYRGETQAILDKAKIRVHEPVGDK